MRRGATSNPPNRFETLHYDFSDAEPAPDDETPDPRVQYLRDPSRTIVATNDSPDVGFEASVNPYRGCAHACVYCLAPGTRVLRADLTSVPIADLRVGDEVLAFDEHAGPGRPRKLRTGTVRASWWTTRPTLRIITDTTEIVTSPEHRWLDARGRWRSASQLTAGARLRRVPIGEERGRGSIDARYRVGYLAGLTLGDGTVRWEPGWRSSRLGFPAAYWRVALKDREPLERLVAYLRDFDLEAGIRPFDPGPNSRTSMEKVELRSLGALRRLHRVLRIDDASSSYRRGFVAGFFDAEGSHSDSLRMSQVDVAVLARVQSYARDFGFEFKLEYRPGAASTIRLVGPQSDRIRFFQIFEPAIARKRLAIAGERLRTIAEPIRAIEPGPPRSLVDIETSTGTFFASSLATHNCFARPTHEYLGLSSGLDFETKIFVKEQAPALLRRELASPRWQPRVVAMSGVTDPYQPIERTLRLTRGCLEVLAEFRNPVAIVTKGRLVARDADLLAELARHDAASVSVSITTLDSAVHRSMEPRTPRPELRLAAIEALATAGVPVGVLVAPVVPGLTDHELPRILEAAARAGASHAGFVVLRLPHATKELVEDWLARDFPDRKDKVLNRVRELRSGALYDTRWGLRQRGTGLFADQIRQLFEAGCRRAGIADEPRPLSTAHFRRTETASGQRLLF